MAKASSRVQFSMPRTTRIASFPFWLLAPMFTLTWCTKANWGHCPADFVCVCGGGKANQQTKKTEQQQKKSSSFDIDLRIPAQAAIIKLQQVPEYREKEKHNWEKRTGKRLGTRQRLEELLEELYIFFPHIVQHWVLWKATIPINH